MSTRSSSRAAALRGAALLAAALAVTSCSSGSDDSSSSESSSSGSTSSAGFPVTVGTAFGDVTVDEAPVRVVALGWGDAETALALGVQPVGASDWLGFGGEGVGPWAEGRYDQAPEIIDTLAELRGDRGAGAGPHPGHQVPGHPGPVRRAQRDRPDDRPARGRRPVPDQLCGPAADDRLGAGQERRGG